MSIVVAAHDAAGFLPDALASVRSQDRADHEVIVVDDGSSDGTGEIARALGARTIRQARRGPAAARNLGVRAARGRLICFLDADDRWPADRLHIQTARHLANEELAYTVGHYRAFLDGATARPPWLRPRALAQGEIGFFAGTLMVTRQALEHVGLFDPGRMVGETADWFIRARQAGLPFAVLPEVLLFRRIHGGNLTHRGEEINASILHSLKTSLDRRRTRGATLP